MLLEQQLVYSEALVDIAMQHVQIEYYVQLGLTQPQDLTLEHLEVLVMSVCKALQVALCVLLENTLTQIKNYA